MVQEVVGVEEVVGTDEYLVIDSVDTDNGFVALAEEDEEGVDVDAQTLADEGVDEVHVDVEVFKVFHAT